MDDRRRTRLRQAFQDSLPLPEALEPNLREALDRVLAHPGSLIRPEIVHAIATGYGIGEPAATNLAIALEYFHTASLLFDDLPCMDDAAERRGIPCTHVKFGDAGAILTALALINRAYALTWRAAAAVPVERQQRALEFVERYLGVGGLLNGQSTDLHYASLPHDRGTTESIAMGKTVSLIRLTLVLPALLGGASELELRLLDRIAVFWGLSYQIVDDLRDVLQTARESGKTPARDASLGRPNLALAAGVPEAEKRLRRLIGLGDRMFRQLTLLRPQFGFLAEFRAELAVEASQMTQPARAAEMGATA